MLLIRPTEMEQGVTCVSGVRCNHALPVSCPGTKHWQEYLTTGHRLRTAFCIDSYFSKLIWSQLSDGESKLKEMFCPYV